MVRAFYSVSLLLCAYLRAGAPDDDFQAAPRRLRSKGAECPPPRARAARAARAATVAARGRHGVRCALLGALGWLR